MKQSKAQKWGEDADEKKKQLQAEIYTLAVRKAQLQGMCVMNVVFDIGTIYFDHLVLLNSSVISWHYCNSTKKH